MGRVSRRCQRATALHKRRADDLSVRPEHVERCGATDAVATLQVRRVEQFGAQTFASGEWAGVRINTLIARDDALRPGDRLPIRIPAERLHLFDRASGRRLNGTPA